MNILILSPFLPYPLDQGGKIRIFNIIKNLAQAHTVTLAALVDDRNTTDPGPLREICTEIVLVERPARLWPDRFAFFTGGARFNVIRYRSAELRRELLQLRQRQTFDLVQVEFPMMWQYADIFTGIPVVLDAHNIESHNVRQIGDACRSPLWRALYRLEERRLRAVEEQAWRECALCFAVSDRERDEITASAGDPARVITAPNGVDLERFAYRPRKSSGKNILFLGGMDYTPNLDAACWFLDEIFPQILRQEPETRLLMVGRELGRIGDSGTGNRGPGTGDRESGTGNRDSGTGNGERGSVKPGIKHPVCADPGSRIPDPKSIEFHENVPDVLPWFYEADLLAVPLRQGAGTRIKVIEAMAAGLPVVTTSKGCEGIAARDGEHLLVADSAEDFAAAVQKLLTDSRLRTTIAGNARKLVESRYTWQAAVETMVQSYGAVTHE